MKSGSMPAKDNCLVGGLGKLLFFLQKRDGGLYFGVLKINRKAYSECKYEFSKMVSQK